MRAEPVIVEWNGCQCAAYSCACQQSILVSIVNREGKTQGSTIIRWNACQCAAYSCAC